MEFYKEYYVNEKANSFIKKIWILDNYTSNTIKKKLQILPNGCFNIAIVQGKGLKVTTSKEVFLLPQGIFLCSQMTKKVLVDVLENTQVLLVQCFVWITDLFPKIDNTNFKDQLIEIDNTHDILSKINFNSKIIPEDLVELTNNSFKTIESPVPQGIIYKIAQQLITRNFSIPIKDIAKTLNISERSLQLKFKKATGLTPKQYQMILKFRTTIDQITTSKDNEKSLTDIALINKYFDQPHFNHNFKKITAINPKKFKAEDFVLSKI
jgi:AraC-like DNA-binding protein